MLLRAAISVALLGVAPAANLCIPVVFLQLPEGYKITGAACHTLPECQIQGFEIYVDRHLKDSASFQ